MIILDANIVISFGNAGHFYVIEDLRCYPLAIGQRACSEVLKDPARAALRAAIASRRIQLLSIDIADPTEQAMLVKWDSRAAFRNRGEAEVLAIAQARNLIVGSDEKPVRSAARAELGNTRIAGTVDFLRWAVQEGRLELKDARVVLSSLDCGAPVLAQISRQHTTLEDLLR